MSRILKKIQSKVDLHREIYQPYSTSEMIVSVLEILISIFVLLSLQLCHCATFPAFV